MPEIPKLCIALSCTTPCVVMLLHPDIFIQKTAALKQHLQNVQVLNFFCHLKLLKEQDFTKCQGCHCYTVIIIYQPEFIFFPLNKNKSVLLLLWLFVLFVVNTRSG